MDWPEWRGWKGGWMGYSREDRQIQRVQGVQSLHVHPVREGGREVIRPRCLSALFPPASPAPLLAQSSLLHSNPQREGI